MALSAEDIGNHLVSRLNQPRPHFGGHAGDPADPGIAQVGDDKGDFHQFKTIEAPVPWRGEIELYWRQYIKGGFGYANTFFWVLNCGDDFGTVKSLYFKGLMTPIRKGG